MNLAEKLKDFVGNKFYTTVYGEVTLRNVDSYILIVTEDDEECILNKEGKICHKGECILFPSKDQRDWNKWIEEQEPKVPKTWSEVNGRLKAKHCSLYWEIKDGDIELTPIEKSILAFFKIHHLINTGYGGNITTDEWKKRSVTKWRIGFDYDGYLMTDYCVPPIAYTPIAFHTKEQAEEFLKYPENIRILKDYYMIR